MVKETPITERLNQVFEARIGRILEVYQENKQNSNDKRLYCSIEVFPSGKYENVPFWGGGFDLDDTIEMPHGIFCPPRINQMILIMFINGSFENPFAAIPIPMPHDYSFKDKYNDLMESIDDIAIYHYSGSRIIMRADGTIDIQKRIEETTDNFVNHTLKIKFEYTGGIRKKTITDVDNDTIIQLTTDDTIITDTKNQMFKMHSKDNEEYVKIVDTASQEIEMYAVSGSNKITIKRGADQSIILELNKNTIKQSATQYIEQGAASTDIKGTAINMMAATENFVKGLTLCNAFTALCATIATATSGTTAQNAAGIETIKTAFSTFNGLIASFKSSTIKGE